MKQARSRRPPLIGRLVVFGVGLIGGSFAAALKKHQAVGHVVGVGRSRANLQAAKRLGIIDEIASDPALAVRDADLVLIAVPLGQTREVMKRIAPHLAPHTIVTDAGSTKRDVIEHARRSLGGAFSRFVPAHPIAGTEKSGARAADAELFADHLLVVTPERATDQRAVKRVLAAWKLAGMRTVSMDADEHDRVLALTSHLPHVVAFALVSQIAGYADAKKLFQYTGGGFRDTTRIAGSSPEMWRDICIANRGALLNALDDYAAELTRARKAIAAGNGRALEKMFTQARAARAKWLPKR